MDHVEEEGGGETEETEVGMTPRTAESSRQRRAETQELPELHKTACTRRAQFRSDKIPA